MYLLDRLRTDAGLDQALGFPTVRATSPWDTVSPDDTWRKRVQDRASRVSKGQDRYTSKELQEIIATLLRGQ